MILRNQRLNISSFDIIIRTSRTRRLSGQKTDIQFSIRRGTGVDFGDPRIVVEARYTARGFGIDVVSCCAAVGAVVVELDPEDVELGGLDGGAHVRFI